jgi:hypothetical protein
MRCGFLTGRVDGATYEHLMKVKVGTQLEDEVYRELKVFAARQKRPISEVIQHALTDFLHRSKGSGGRKSGLARLLAREPLKVTGEQFREVVELDYFDR